MGKFYRVYIVECQTPGYFYVGSTSRVPYLREDEHRNGHGSHWTSKHGFKRMLFMKVVPQEICQQLEDDLTVWLQATLGYRFVRGGNRVATSEKTLQKWMHPSLAGLLPTDVLPLHSRPMGEFPAELRRLVDAFEMVRRLEDPDHLDSDVQPEAALRGRPD